MWPVVVAAATTWLLQPLDTHAFALYKCRLQKAYQTLRIRSADGRVGVAGLLVAMYVAIREVLVGRHWAPAFARNGFGTSQAEVSERVLSHLEMTPPLAIACTQPTVDQLRLCWPRGMLIPVADVWHRQEPLVGAAPAEVPEDPLRRSARIAAMAAPAAAAAPIVVAHRLLPRRYIAPERG